MMNMVKKKVTNKKKELHNIGSLKLNKNILVADHIKNKLNELFYVKPDYDAELEMLKYQYDQEEEERVGLHASAITSAGKDFCYREQVLSLFFKMAQGENIPIGLKRIFEEGKSIGTKWQRLFIRAGIGDKEDMDVSRIQQDFDLSYTPDGIVVIDGKKYVVEIKSQNTFGFQKAKSHPSGQKQLKLYMYFEKIPRGFVLVEDKNLQDFKVFLETFEGETQEDWLAENEDIYEIVERLETIQKMKNKFLKTKKPPKRIDMCTSVDCKRAQKCNMREACWGIRREKINSK